MPPHNRMIPHSMCKILHYLFALGALYAGLAVATQALATHLPDAAFLPPQGRSMVQKAADIALWHGIALCALTLGVTRLHPLRLTIGCLGLALGTTFFSIPVALHGFGYLLLARLAPLGGSMIILSWLCVASSALGQKKP
ncbi:DUF423 domain-containing protein [Bombella sp. ESL0378]|nr:DUF423 domain-containing protein [Bombella sp. ESL0378]